jgi:hypothetical protein
MPYKLVLSEPQDLEMKRGEGSVFFDNLPSDYEVYVFYYLRISLRGVHNSFFIFPPARLIFERSGLAPVNTIGLESG